MKYTHTISLLFTLIISSFLSCSPQSEQDFNITYQVDVQTDIPLKLFISYKDSSDYVRLWVTDKKWSQQVSLSSHDLASLLVCVPYNENLFDNQYIQWHSTDMEKFSIDRSVVLVKIVHPNKTVYQYAESLALLSLFQADCAQ